ncbi:WbqC family protein [Vibrio genomosp. F10]|uniref:WbqC family protein n=1 Tax=Vibrio genomosp. F10 TaxID=723171 RepID=UPI0002F430B0|nr:WbqC family protein [Vibrio genomosp. F10]OEF06216.1 hypothetical protein A1QI_07000 [Vibrio genomosp. F10 str. 9ZB36]
MNKKVAILQSNYIPWKGYFDLMSYVDEFVLYDDMQYTKRDWRNRNKIKTNDGVKWLSIPVEVKGKYFQPIKDTKVSDKHWGKKHWNSIQQNYSKSKFFDEYKSKFETIYLQSSEERLSIINYEFIRIVNEILGIDTKIRWSSDFSLVDGKSERLLGICQDCNATEYISGPAAKGYLDESVFLNNDIRVTWMDYSGYPEYEQRFDPFEHGVTILDLIFNEGPQAYKFMKHVRYNESV